MTSFSSSHLVSLQLIHQPSSSKYPPENIEGTSSLISSLLPRYVYPMLIYTFPPQIKYFPSCCIFLFLLIWQKLCANLLIRIISSFGNSIQWPSTIFLLSICLIFSARYLTCDFGFLPGKFSRECNRWLDVSIQRGYTNAKEYHHYWSNHLRQWLPTHLRILRTTPHHQFKLGAYTLKNVHTLSRLPL